ncbi:MAG: hemerythrin domain-containing protein [Elusimicrobia bacterium]|nr:hemerythrin domain-containing protein [Elusimicrobiota bacterium]
MADEMISDFFKKDHDEIDALLAAVDFDRPKEALPILAEFDRRLERHIVWEEEILFPTAARLAPPLAHGPIAVMLEEHILIRKDKRDALERLAAGDGAGAKRSTAAMLEVLGGHNMKEEQILYPTCDRVLAGAQAARVMDVIREKSRG